MKSKIFLAVFLLYLSVNAMAQNKLIPKKDLPQSRLELSRRTQNGSFFDVIGRKSAIFGYEHRNLEAWVYPLKVVDDFALDFQIEGYNIPFQGKEVLTNITVRPEATIFTYSHAAFTVRQIVFAPVDEQGLLMLLDIKSVLPMTVGVSFRPKLRLMWAGNTGTPSVGQNDGEKYYWLADANRRFYGVVGSPNAKDVSLMPYQEEAKDLPLRYTLQISPAEADQNFVPIAISASTEGFGKAVENYRKLLKDAVPLYEKNVKYYEDFLSKTTQISTPDERLNTAFNWAKIGTEKGVATNPYLGTGLLAGFRTSGESERPGFAWYFGRDSMWTALAINSYGDFATSKEAISFLKKYQRTDGKIPHEISQSATLIDWWKGFTYPWDSTDATPLYIIVNADLFKFSGDLEYLKSNWESILKAYKFQETTDTDGNGLIENTKFGHGWIEGDGLYPAHEEIYLQGVWIEASKNMAEIAELMGDKETAERAKANAEKTYQALEKTYWLNDKGFYSHGTQIPPKEPVKAEKGPYFERRQKRLNELQKQTLYDEDTVLPAVPMWWRVMRDDERAQKQIDRLGSAKIATDWGARILANDSQLYDPLSYHSGSVWGLFTGWQSMAAYNYGRPHIGYQALMANSLLTYTNALGYATELLSGDFNAPFGSSSHHQVWSEAMVISPFLRGMFGIEISNAGKAVRFAPQVPANWSKYEVNSIRAGGNSFDFKVKREQGKMTIGVFQQSINSTTKLIFAPAFPLDAKIKSVTVSGKKFPFQINKLGDIQQAEIQFDATANAEIIYLLDEGTDVYWDAPDLKSGQENQGLRIIKSQAKAEGLFLILEGRGGQTYQLNVRSPRFLKDIEIIGLTTPTMEQRLKIQFEGDKNNYIRREMLLPFKEETNPKEKKK